LKGGSGERSISADRRKTMDFMEGTEIPLLLPVVSKNPNGSVVFPTFIG
jgi:hypothetical protein